MADIYDEFVTYLKTQSDITDLVGTGTAARIFPEVPKQNATLPFIVAIDAGGGQSYTAVDGAPSGLAETVWHVYAYDSTRSGADTLSEAIRLAGPLQGRIGTMGSTGTKVLAPLHRDGGVDLARDGQYQPRFWIRTTYHMFYVQATSS